MEQLQLPLLWAMLSAYVGAFVLYVFSVWSMKPSLNKVANIVALIGLGINGVLMVMRTMLIQGLPLNNGFEFAMCFVFALVLAFFILNQKFGLSSMGIFVMPIAAGLSAWMVTIDMSIAPLMPALRSNWLAFHVSTAVVAYGAFAVACASGIAYLVKEKAETRGTNRMNEFLPKREILDEVTYKMIFIGLPFLTIMLITGAVWAEFAWGRFWSWDPKETAALITWLIYAGYLHTRFMKGWKGRKSAILAIIGFFAVMFTFIGVSYLPGLHGYLG